MDQSKNGYDQYVAKNISRNSRIYDNYGRKIINLKWKDIAKYHRVNSDNEKSNEKDEKDHLKTKKDIKVQFNTIKKGFYCHNCYNEGHFTTNCKLLDKCCQICKSNERNTNQCPTKTINGRCPSREIVPIHIVQAKSALVIQDQHQQSYEAPPQ
jgi:hypothetical protein